MDIRTLECFQKICEHGSMTKASKSLFISPQGLSRLIQKLESDVGVVLFERTQHGMSPTTAGLIFLEHVNILLTDYHKLETCLNNNELKKTPLNVVMGLGARTYLGYNLLDAFHEKHPEIFVKIQEYPDAMAYEEIQNGSAEVGIIPGPADYTLFHSDIVASIPHVAIVRKDDPLTNIGHIGYDDFEGRTLVMVSHQFMPFKNVLGRLARYGIALEGVEEAGEVLKVSQMVRRNVGIGISVLDETADYIYPGTAVIPFDDKELTWDLYLVHSQGVMLSTSALDFYSFVLDWCNSGQPEFYKYSIQQPPECPVT